MSNAVICIYIYVIDQAQIKMAGYWLSFFFFETKSSRENPFSGSIKREKSQKIFLP